MTSFPLPMHNVNSWFVADDTFLVYNLIFLMYLLCSHCFLLWWPVFSSCGWVSIPGFLFTGFSFKFSRLFFYNWRMFKKRRKLNGLWACLLQDASKGRYKLAGFSAASWGFCVNQSWEINCFGQLELLVWIQLVKTELESGLISRPGIG